MTSDGLMVEAESLVGPASSLQVLANSYLYGPQMLKMLPSKL